METVTTQTKFYSRRMTNDIRDQIIFNAKKHVNEEFTKNPLFIESKEIIAVFTKAFMEEFYKEIPEEDFNTIMKYAKLTDDYGFFIAKNTTREGKEEYACNHWGYTMKFGPNLDDRYILPAIGQNKVYEIVVKTYNNLGHEFCKKFFDTLYLNDCEKKKIFSAIITIVKSATTTGKLVEAYPDMIKFIPDQYKEKEEKYTTPIKRSVASTGVDVSEFLK